MLTATTANKKQYLVGGAIVLLAAVTLFVIVPQLGNFDNSLHSLQAARIELVVLAALAALAPCIIGAMIYAALATKRLRLSSTVLVQASGLFINRVLPAGVGGIGLNIWYLKHKRHSLAQATTLVAFNNVLGVLGNTFLLLGALLFFAGSQLEAVGVKITAPRLLIIVGACFVLGGLVYLIQKRLARFTRQFIKEVRRLVMRFAKQPQRFAAVFALSCCLTIANVMSFWLCCQAIGLDTSVIACFFILSLSVLVGTAVPTPGGLGGVEAALVAGLISQSVDASTALGAALLFRLVSYWLGLLVGLLSLAGLEHRLRHKVL